MLIPQIISSAIASRRRTMQPVHAQIKDKALPHPAAHAPRIFADTANLTEIKNLREAGLINGVTTNPTLLKRAGAQSQQHAYSLMQEIVKYMHPDPVSLEITSVNYAEMIKEASHLAEIGANVVVKVPVSGYEAAAKTEPSTGLKVIRKLWQENIKTNATLIFSSTQAFLAANAGATYVSPFLGRIGDYMIAQDSPDLPIGNSLHFLGGGPADKHHNSAYVACGEKREDAGVRLIHEITTIFANYGITTEILAASFRNLPQVSDCLLSGADILTIPTAILKQAFNHPLSDKGFLMFLEDAKAWRS